MRPELTTQISGQAVLSPLLQALAMLSWVKRVTEQLVPVGVQIGGLLVVVVVVVGIVVVVSVLVLEVLVSVVVVDVVVV